jgi:hypothetical protein
MGEIPGTTEPPSADGISTRSTTKRSPGQVWTKRRRKWSTSSNLAEIRSNPSRPVSIDIGLDTGSNGRDKGTSRTGREVAATGLSDSSGAVDRLASIDTSVNGLIS